MSSRSRQNKQGNVAKAQSSPGLQSDKHDPSQRELVSMQAEYRGPLPPPAMLERYEQSFPGLGERLISSFEKESEHRQQMEHKIVDAQIYGQRSDAAAFRWGQNFAFAIAVVGLFVSGFCVYHAASTGQAWAGASIGGVSLATLVGAFVYGRKATPPDPDRQPDKKK